MCGSFSKKPLPKFVNAPRALFNHTWRTIVPLNFEPSIINHTSTQLFLSRHQFNPGGAAADEKLVHAFSQNLIDFTNPGNLSGRAWLITCSFNSRQTRAPKSLTETDKFRADHQQNQFHIPALRCGSLSWKFIHTQNTNTSTCVEQSRRCRNNKVLPSVNNSVLFKLNTNWPGYLHHVCLRRTFKICPLPYPSAESERAGALYY